MEEEYGYHDTAYHHRCAAIARRRLVRPRSLVLVSEVFLAKRDDATESELHRFLEGRLESRPPNPVRATTTLARRRLAEFGSYAALVNPPERGRTDVVLTGPQSTHRYVWSSLSEWVG
jgi:hypothetical protein